VRIVFLGSGAFAVPSLEALVRAGYEVAAVVTQPDKEKGRGRAMAAPPVKPAALALGLRVLQPRRIKLDEAYEQLRPLAADVQVVIAYGQILPGRVIALGRLGTVNVHASLLPQYRGAAPIQWAIVNGERETGVTTMLIDEGLDTGPTLLARSTAIGPEERAPELEARLARLGAEVLLETLAGLGRGSLVAVPQDHARATLAPLLRKEDARVDWRLDAAAIERRVRGFDPWPGTVCLAGGRSLRILRAREAGPVAADPGTILSAGREGIHVACGGGTSLLVTEVQPESRGRMTAAAFVAGARLAPGERFD
jgi:methionyl-tRNA formyltransferase